MVFVYFSVVDPRIPGFKIKKGNFYMKIYLVRSTTKVQKPFQNTENKVYLSIMVDFNVPGIGSRSAFPIWIQIQIQDSQMNADLWESGNA
jgi:hypothetical protein